MVNLNAPEPGGIERAASAPLKRAGRPQAASRGFLEEAAAELFLEQGFAATTIADIAQRAGVARSTFFNYFTSKADVLWSGFDAAVENLGKLLADSPRPDADSPRPHADAAESSADSPGPYADFPQPRAIEDLLVDWAATVPPENVVMVYTQAEPMGLTPEDIQIAAGSRFMQLVEVLTAGIADFTGTTGLATATSTPHPAPDFAGRLLAGSYAGILMIAVEQWAQSGGQRGELATFVRQAFDHLPTHVYRAPSPHGLPPLTLRHPLTVRRMSRFRPS